MISLLASELLVYVGLSFHICSVQSPLITWSSSVVGVAVKITEVPIQIEDDEAVIATADVTVEVTIMVTVLEVAVVGDHKTNQKSLNI